MSRLKKNTVNIEHYYTLSVEFRRLLFLRNYSATQIESILSNVYTIYMYIFFPLQKAKTFYEFTFPIIGVYSKSNCFQGTWMLYEILYSVTPF